MHIFRSNRLGPETTQPPPTLTIELRQIPVYIYSSPQPTPPTSSRNQNTPHSENTRPYRIWDYDMNIFCFIVFIIIIFILISTIIVLVHIVKNGTNSSYHSYG
ncbi:hypothetical protein B9Z55_003492 [Caenorhabditis nigoni]|uniref:Uncharacterized protein n=1 Tax=Caenorhabditis nigoni TaxID=1611254 RepID=A0A2G5VQX8_9PELO|nr:hypothetical protein B9Z55_003492 [Caenorhabditis nigoni]